MNHRYFAPALFIVLTIFGGAISSSLAENAATIERRLGRTAQFLSADELAGRGLGTPEIDLAAEYIRQQFADMGLKTDLVDGSAFQPFSYTLSAKLGDDSRAALVNGDGGGRIELRTGENYQPLAIGGAGTVDAPLVFAGYGITAAEADYDDYRDIDVNGKVVIILRHEPQQGNPHSVFNGTDHSEHAPFRRKIKVAMDNGAAGIIFCTGQFEIDRQLAEWRGRHERAMDKLAEVHAEFARLARPTARQRAEHRRDVAQISRRVAEYADRLVSEQDPLLPFEGAGPSAGADRLPVLFVNRETINRLFSAAGKPELLTLEERIDEGLEPQSFELDGWRLAAHVDIAREEVEIKNVIGVLEGAGDLADETVVIGAHYDHLGRGGAGSAAPGSNEIHNGADDNASGTAALLEVARHFATRDVPPARRLVFIAFTGEERGLLGSAHYVNHPLYPLESTVAMINFDMVGRLNDNKLMASGFDTASEFAGWLDEVNERHGFDLIKTPGGLGPSDHASFYSKQIPVIHLFTGLHKEYHRPGDDFELLNVDGMRRVSQFANELIERVATAPERPTFTASIVSSRPDRPQGTRPYFGSIPDFSQVGGGYAISGVAPESPAAVAGLAGGDVIVRLGDQDITNLEDFDAALRNYEAGDKVPVVVKRDGVEQQFEVVLDPPR